MTLYRCSKCREHLPADAFRRDASRRNRDGLAYRCRRCVAPTGERLEQIDATRRALELVQTPPKERDSEELQAVYDLLMLRARVVGDCYVAAPDARLRGLRLAHVVYAFANRLTLYENDPLPPDYATMPLKVQRLYHRERELHLTTTCGTPGCVRFDHLCRYERKPPGRPARSDADVERASREAQERREAEQREQRQRETQRSNLARALLTDESLDLAALGPLSPQALAAIVDEFAATVARDKTGCRWPDDRQLIASREHARLRRPGRPAKRTVYTPTPQVRRMLRRLAALVCLLPGCSDPASPYFAEYHEATDKYAATLAAPLDDFASYEEVLLIRRYSRVAGRLREYPTPKGDIVTPEQIRSEVIHEAARIVVDEYVGTTAAPSIDDVLMMRAPSDTVVDLDAYRRKRNG